MVTKQLIEILLNIIINLINEVKDMNEFKERLNKIAQLLDESDNIIIGAGAGLSTAAGIEYDGKRFTDNFQEFIDKYDMTDMYTSGFYPFDTEEEKWAYWARHIYLNNVGMQSTKLYTKLYDLVKDKNYFVITTNVDDQFFKSNFEASRVFATQGSYNYIQCSKGCHPKVYKNSQLIKEMINSTDKDLKIPSNLVPKCPVCDGPMDPHLRKDHYFVEDEHWHYQSNAYNEFINSCVNEKTLLLEFGIGFNTPSIIRFPFEQMTYKIKDWTLARFNRSHFEVAVEYHKTWKLMTPEELSKIDAFNDFLSRYIRFSEDIEEVLDNLL